jgi:hypothetical protein
MTLLLVEGTLGDLPRVLRRGCVAVERSRHVRATRRASPSAQTVNSFREGQAGLQSQDLGRKRLAKHLAGRFLGRKVIGGHSGGMWSSRFARSGVLGRAKPTESLIVLVATRSHNRHDLEFAKVKRRWCVYSGI